MPSGTFGLKLTGLILFAAIVASPFVWKACRADDQAEVATVATLKERGEAAGKDIVRAIELLEPVGTGPWAARGQLKEVAEAERQRLRGRVLSLRSLRDFIDREPDEERRRALTQQVETISTEFAGHRQRIEPFRTLWDEDVTVVSEGFLALKKINESLGRLQESGVDISPRAAAVRAISKSIEDGVRFWSNGMAAILSPAESSKKQGQQLQLRKIGLESIRSVRDDLQKISEPVLRAALTNDRLRNTIVGTRRTLKRRLEVNPEDAKAQLGMKRLDEELLPAVTPHRNALLSGPDLARDDAIEAAITDIAALVRP